MAAEAGHSALVRLAVAGARGDAAAVVRAARSARRTGLARRAAEETALMLVLYAGYPAALETLRVLNAVWPGRARRTREGGISTWRHRGTALSRRVYGPVHGRLIAAVRGLHPDLAAWMVEQGYGRVLSRRGLALGVREEITVAVLAALGRERQLVSHLLGAARAGVRTGAIRRALVAGATTRPAVHAARSVAGRAWRSAFPGRR
jgi:alkylhydroperoxidase/carboxymuconolactone decarboxylase family protein YurZ